MRGQGSVRRATEVTGEVHAARSHSVHAGVVSSSVVDAGRTASTDEIASSEASTSVVVGTVGVHIGSGASALSFGKGKTTDNARLIGEVGAGGNALGHHVVEVALGQPRAAKRRDVGCGTGARHTVSVVGTVVVAAAHTGVNVVTAVLHARKVGRADVAVGKKLVEGALVRDPRTIGQGELAIRASSFAIKHISHDGGSVGSSVVASTSASVVEGASVASRTAVKLGKERSLLNGAALG